MVGALYQVRPGAALRLMAFACVLAALVLPILAGMGFTLAAAFGFVPGLSGLGSGWQALTGLPGLRTSVLISLGTGFGAAIVSLLLALALLITWGARAGRWIAVPLAMPHAAMALGLGFLIAPSGWIARMAAPVFGWEVPPAIVTLHDGWGGALMLGLVVKETPFLLLVALAAASRMPVADTLRAGRALGHPAVSVWIWGILPELLRAIRLPVLVVLAYGLSVVDMAILMGPTHPPTLAVLITRAYAAPDPLALPLASSGAVLMLALVGLAFALWLAMGRMIWWGVKGLTGIRLCLSLWPLAMLGALGIGLSLVALAMLGLWAFAGPWLWPAPMPQTLSLQIWAEGRWLRPLGLSALIGGIVTTLSMALAILWLEGEDRGQVPRARWAAALIALPLILPQIGMMIGMNMALLQIGLSGSLTAVIWAQMLYVFPYVMLTLEGPWRALPTAPMKAAASLGAGPWRRLLALRLPMLGGPLLTALAVGFAVSVAQYLPVLFAGAGRVATLTTEAVALGAGSDRRLAALVALWQAGLPLAGYALALALPRWWFRDRAGMSAGMRGGM